MLRSLIFTAMLTAAELAGGGVTPFEVASIRLHDPNSVAATMKFLPGGTLSISGMSIRNLIWLAWQLPPERISGGPKWLDSELYDIQAKPPAGSSSAAGKRLMDEQYQRIQALLTDRCQLRVHREARSTNVYLLTVAKTGLRMQEAKGTDPSNTKGSIAPWELFVQDLSRRLGRPVVDRTGMKGAWYVKLQYVNDDGKPAGMGVNLDPAQSATGPSIFTAVQEQLGLKLDPSKGMVDTLVIDSVMKPSAN
jgi:uncharacterized protein (TIGR03435 family)